MRINVSVEVVALVQLVDQGEVRADPGDVGQVVDVLEGGTWLVVAFADGAAECDVDNVRLRTEAEG
jgi:hypothetical protein